MVRHLPVEHRLAGSPGERHRDVGAERSAPPERARPERLAVGRELGDEGVLHLRGRWRDGAPARRRTRRRSPPRLPRRSPTGPCPRGKAVAGLLARSRRCSAGSLRDDWHTSRPVPESRPRGLKRTRRRGIEAPRGDHGPNTHSHPRRRIRRSLRRARAGEAPRPPVRRRGHPGHARQLLPLHADAARGGSGRPRAQHHRESRCASCSDG